jgi:hypothetical protein
VTKKLSADFSRRIFLEQNFGTAGAVPSKLSPNEFGAQEKFVINHWLKPVA